mgnify:CR=1 FL=1
MKTEKIDIRPYTRQFYKRNKVCFIAMVLVVILTALGNLLVSWLLQQITDIIGGYDTGFSLSGLIMISLVMVAGIVLVGFISYFTKPKFITRGISQYKAYIFEELTKKNISAFSGESSSVYISALTNDIQTIEQGYLWNTFSMVECILVFIGALALMLWYSPLLTFIAIGLCIFPLITSLLVGDRVAQAEKTVSDQNATYTATLKDSLSGFSVIKSFKAESQMLSIFRENIQKLSAAQCKKQKITIIIETLGAASGIIAQIGVFLFGAYLALSGKGITAGTTVIFVQLMNFILNPIGTLPGLLAQRKAAKALVTKIAEALQANVREEAPAAHQPLTEGIQISNLSFGYEAEKPVLQNINCTFELGKKYAIVGASGSGKSTLLNLLMASYENYEGTILYDDRELRQIGSSDLYETQSIIQQNVFVFNATIRENITMFRVFPEKEIQEAIRLSGLSALIAEKSSKPVASVFF